MHNNKLRDGLTHKQWLAKLKRLQRAASYNRDVAGHPIKYNGSVCTEQELRWYNMEVADLEHWWNVVDGKKPDLAPETATEAYMAARFKHNKISGVTKCIDLVPLQEAIRHRVAETQVELPLDDRPPAHSMKNRSYLLAGSRATAGCKKVIPADADQIEKQEYNDRKAETVQKLQKAREAAAAMQQQQQHEPHSNAAHRQRYAYGDEGAGRRTPRMRLQSPHHRQETPSQRSNKQQAPRDNETKPPKKRPMNPQLGGRGCPWGGTENAMPPPN